MFAEIIWFPRTASTTAGSVDRLLIFLTSITGAVGLLVAVLLIYFAVRYRRRPGQPPPAAMPGNKPLELFWTITPMFVFLGFFAYGVVVYFDAYRAPDDAQVVYVVAKQWM